MSTEKRITQEAKQRLSDGNWSKVICGSILYTCIPIIILLLYMIVSTIFEADVFDLSIYEGGFNTNNILLLVFTGVLVLVCFMFTPLMLGFKKLSYQIAKNDSPEFNDLFFFFKSSERYFSAIRLYFFKVLYFVFYAIVYYVIPVLLTVYFKDVFAYTGLDDSFKPIIIAALVIIYVISSLLMLSSLLRQYLMSFIFCDDDNYSVFDALSLSGRLMHGNKMKIVKLFIKMIPWMLTCVAVMPILYVLPYMKECFAVCSKWIIQQNSAEDAVK
ncbi:MAG: DUF975 family protein [Acutalibacteraceae bacterium]